jgi:hypothetical protein
MFQNINDRDMLYGFGTWFLTLRKEHKCVFKSSASGEYFDPGRPKIELSEKCRILHNEEYCDTDRIGL